MRKIKFIVAVFFQMIFGLSISQENISGYIKDEDQQVMEGVAVKLLQTNRGTISDADGYFEIKNVIFPCTLEITSLGFKTFRDTVVSSGQVKDYAVILQKDIFLADEFTVTATRAEVTSPFTYSNIDKKQIETMSNGRDIPFIINQSPGVVASSDAGAGIGYTKLRIRGVDQTNINVTINGISLNDAESHDVYWVDVPDLSSSISDIQIQRGIGTSTNGAGAFGATVNLLTDKLNSSPYGEISASAGTFQTYKGSVKFGSGLIKGKWTVDGRLSTILSEGYVDRASSDLKSYFFSSGFNNGKTSLKGIVFGGVEETYQAWYGVDKFTLETDRTFNYAGAIYNNDGSLSFYENQVDHYAQDHFQLLFNHKITESLLINAAAHYTYGRGYYESYHQEDSLYYYGIPDFDLAGLTVRSSDIIDREWLDNHFYGLNYSLQYNTKTSSVILGGALNQYDGDHYGEILWVKADVPTSYSNEYYRNKGLKNDVSIYLKYTREIKNSLRLMVDVQYRTILYDVHGDAKYYGPIGFSDQLSFFNPKLGADYKLSANKDVYYSIASAGREPNRNDYLNGDNFTAKPEQLLNQELGYRQKFSGNWIQVNLYHMYYLNQLVLTGEINNVGEPLRGNVGRSYRAGVEISAGIDVFRFLKWSPNISLARNRNLNFKTIDENGISSTENTPISFSPDFIINNGMGFQITKKLTLNIFSYYIGKQYLDNSGNKDLELSVYHMHDVRLDYKSPGKKPESWGLYIAANNVFNAQYVSNGYVWDGIPIYFPQAGLNFMAGLNIRF